MVQSNHKFAHVTKVELCDILKIFTSSDHIFLFNNDMYIFVYLFLVSFFLTKYE